jgi:aspartate/methionine/tyrosine aminotransferase
MYAEIYGDITFDAPHTCAAEFDPSEGVTGAESHLAVVSGVSKSYAMTGYRVGWARCSPQMARCVSKLQEPVVSCGVPFAQAGAVAALRHTHTLAERHQEALPNTHTHTYTHIDIFIYTDRYRCIGFFSW